MKLHRPLLQILTAIASLIALPSVHATSGTSALFLLDTRNYTDSGDSTVHTDKRAYLVADNVPGSLRQAIDNAAAGETVDFDAGLSSGTIMLGGTRLSIDTDLTIEGPPGGITVNGNNASGVFHISGSSSVVQLDSLTIRSGRAFGGFPANSGAGIFSDGATVTLTNCIVTGNSALSAQGGGIYNETGGVLNIVRSTLSENRAFSGGGIRNFGTVNLTNSTLSGNTATSSAGGGISNLGAVDMNHSTLADNTALSSGGGIFTSETGTLNINNTIVAGNVATTDVNVSGPVPTGSNNLTTGDPLLAPLGDYGGPAETMPPLPGSPAIEGAVLLGTTPLTDQRGNPRPSGPLPDLGAVEAGSLLLGMLADSDNDDIPDVMEGPDGPYPYLTVGIDDSLVDTDGDGSTDAEEIANMTDPNDASDSFRVLGFALAPGFDPLSNPLVSITFSSFPGLDYEAETDNALGTFEPVSGSLLTADDFTETVELLLEPGTKSFGRVGRR